MGMDSSKQLFGAGLIHVLNLLFAQRLQSHYMILGDECDWYWINIVVDCTIGVFVNYLLLHLCVDAILPAAVPDQAHDFKSGEYTEGDSFEAMKYIKQLILWLAIVTIMKLSMV